MDETYRVGRRNPHNLYRQTGDEPKGYDDEGGDSSLGWFRNPLHAERAACALSGSRVFNALPWHADGCLLLKGTREGPAKQIGLVATPEIAQQIVEAIAAASGKASAVIRPVTKAEAAEAVPPDLDAARLFPKRVSDLLGREVDARWGRGEGP